MSEQEKTNQPAEEDAVPPSTTDASSPSTTAAVTSAAEADAPAAVPADEAAEEKDAPAGPIADSQTGSPLFRLPQELRDQIYSYLLPVELSFRSVSIGHYARRQDFYPPLPPLTDPVPPNQLSILLTCRHARAEIGDSWISNVLLVFISAGSMLDKLTDLTPAALALVRHVQVTAYECELSCDHDYISHSRSTNSEYVQGFYYHIYTAFVFLPGLRLDTLTVFGTGYYDCINLYGLVQGGSGWKELRYVSPTSEGLGLGYYSFGATIIGGQDQHQLLGGPRWPQPARWNGILEARDGVGSGSRVTIYRSTEDGVKNSVLDPATRTRFEHEVHEDAESWKAYLVALDDELEAERDKEVMVVVERGVGVDYEVKEDSPFFDDDIRRQVVGRTWKEIREHCRDSTFY